jgi:hypothetical protein
MDYSLLRSNSKNNQLKVIGMYPTNAEMKEMLKKSDDGALIHETVSDTWYDDDLIEQVQNILDSSKTIEEFRDNLSAFREERSDLRDGLREKELKLLRKKQKQQGANLKR